MVFYADDSVMWVSGPDVRLLRPQMEKLLRVFSRFSEEEGIPLSAKSTAHLFHRREVSEVEAGWLDAAPLRCGPLRLPILRTETLNFLGVRFDMGLRWTDHMQYLAGALKPALAALNSLAMVLSPFLLRCVYFGAIESALLYGSSLWAYELKNEVWETLERLQLRAAREITGVIRSTPKDLVLRAAAVYPLRTRARILATRFMEQVRRLGRTCPAAQRLCNPAPAGNRRSTRAGSANLPASLRDAYRSPPLQEPDQPVLLPLSVPFEDPELPQAVTVDATVESLPPLPSPWAERAWKLSRNVAVLRQRFGSAIRDNRHLLLADASVRQPDDEQPEVRTGFGWRVVDRAFRLVAEGAGTCGPLACSFTAECWALTCACRALLESTATCPLVVMTDSQSCLSALALGPCARVTAEIQKLWIYLLQLARRREVTLCFIYSHCGFTIHEEVDKLASWASDYAWVGEAPDGPRPRYAIPTDVRQYCPHRRGDVHGPG
eukprot:gene9923-biopygen6821